MTFIQKTSFCLLTLVISVIVVLVFGAISGAIGLLLATIWNHFFPLYLSDYRGLVIVLSCATGLIIATVTAAHLNRF